MRLLGRWDLVALLLLFRDLLAAAAAAAATTTTAAAATLARRGRGQNFLFQRPSGLDAVSGSLAQAASLLVEIGHGPLGGCRGDGGGGSAASVSESENESDVPAAGHLRRS